eukprot:605562-Amorphochlora_amoeboformis.AAC.1
MDTKYTTPRPLTEEASLWDTPGILNDNTVERSLVLTPTRLYDRSPELGEAIELSTLLGLYQADAHGRVRLLELVDEHRRLFLSGSFLFGPNSKPRATLASTGSRQAL